MFGPLSFLPLLLTLLTGCTPGMFFDLLERATETAEHACTREGGVFTVEKSGEGFRYECRK